MEFISRSVWLIPSFPLLAPLSSGFISFSLPSGIRNLRRLCLFINVSSLIIAMSISFSIFWEQITGDSIHRYLWSWAINGNIILRMGYLIDPLTSIMSISVTTVGFMVMIYSNGYMFYDRGYVRFFCYLGLFTASMLGLILSPNLIQIYIFWELVGMCSYLLIGFWFTRPGVANACQKAFVTNRVGDFGLLLGILGFYWITGSFEFQDLPKQLFNLLGYDPINITTATVFGILFFLGPIAKSAQIPLHVWLPDAMEGPTPVSALIHAATMVAAGIFLVARMLPVFQMLPLVMDTISWIGVITALLGASIAMAQKDLKKGLAYSTISQLGYMMLSLGIGSYKAGLFHLVTHAYSKALLFLGAGSVIHSIESIVGYHPDKSQNMNFMGGLRKYMPITALTFLSGTLSLCGIPPFACFWSKDEILVDSWTYSPLLGFIASSTAALTAYYMFRMYLLTFEGEFRGRFSGGYQIVSHISIWGGLASDREGTEEFHKFCPTYKTKSKYTMYPEESNITMLLPLIGLTIPTLFAGILGIYYYREHIPFDSLSYWFHLSLNPPNKVHSETFIPFLSDAIPSISIASSGILTASSSHEPNSLPTLRSKEFRFAHVVLKYVSTYFHNWSYYRGYIDGLYDLLFVKNSRLLAKYFFMIDQWIFDGIINGTSILSLFGGEGLKHMEGGLLSSYLFFLVSCMFLSSLYSYII
nr:NADH-plastoquinone oxidoreductase subunit 5 [Aneura pinguis]WGO60948.1 NADH-plastoquinone oxidoreductase subunit 5 [Aneura pinguis]WGO61034.1 NADH-plastoquinone oxidoreductase subunit 5 [Aneura pinguis]WGO61120.1 NADH-plastoquinone oxidoreductase subunit 5 [Aneura pinguis]